MFANFATKFILRAWFTITTPNVLGRLRSMPTFPPATDRRAKYFRHLVIPCPQNIVVTTERYFLRLLSPDCSFTVFHNRSARTRTENFCAPNAAEYQIFLHSGTGRAGFEPATFSFKARHSTAELPPNKTRRSAKLNYSRIRLLQ